MAVREHASISQVIDFFAFSLRRSVSVCGRLRFQRFAVASLVAVSTFAVAQEQRPSQPQPPSGGTPQLVAHAKKYMVAAAHPLAVEAGLRMLERGGNAIDAMVATQLALNVVEPGSSGLGGGAFLLYYDARRKQLHAFDARETAPLGATASLFLHPDGTPMPLHEARLSGRSVGVPGVPRLLEVAHARFGKRPWKELFEPAIDLAEKGVPVSARLGETLAQDAGIENEPALRSLYFADDGGLKQPGTVVRNPALAATMRQLASEGAGAFYRGDLAADIVAAVHRHRVPGELSTEDLAGYRVHEVEPVCGNYRQWKVCGMPPPSSGGIAVIQILGMLERFDMASMRGASGVHLITEAERLAFADRAQFIADDAFVEVPTRALIDRGYIAARSQLIRPDRSMGVAKAGEPKPMKVAFSPDPANEPFGTSHIAIVDAEGNAVSMTTTIEWAFGSRIMVRGFLLNNELTDFSFVPAEGGRPRANAAGPGKRPRSAMAPIVVFSRDTDRLEAVAGSAGGSFIIGYVAKTLIAMLDWKLNPQEAVAAPNFGSRNGPTEIERGTELESLAATLKAMGHEVRAIPMTSGTQAISRAADGWQGGADARRASEARGH